MTFRSARGGRVTVKGRVHTGSGVNLSTNARHGVKAGSVVRFYLGTTARAKALLRIGFRSRTRLRTTLWVYADGTVYRTEIHVRR